MPNKIEITGDEKPISSGHVPFVSCRASNLGSCVCCGSQGQRNTSYQNSESKASTKKEWIKPQKERIKMPAGKITEESTHVKTQKAMPHPKKRSKKEIIGYDVDT